MPEHAQLSVQILAVAIHLCRLVHTQILMVLCHNLSREAIGMVVENEVLHEVEEVLFLADTLQHGL